MGCTLFKLTARLVGLIVPLKNWGNGGYVIENNKSIKELLL